MTDTVTALQICPCRKLIPSIASFSGNIGYVTVGRKIEVPLFIASLYEMFDIVRSVKNPTAIGIKDVSPSPTYPLCCQVEQT